jgi:hypothetical protein
MNYIGLVRSGILTLNRCLPSHHRTSSLVLIRSVTSQKSFNATVSTEDENHASSKQAAVLGFVLGVVNNNVTQILTLLLSIVTCLSSLYSYHQKILDPFRL